MITQDIVSSARDLSSMSEYLQSINESMGDVNRMSVRTNDCAKSFEKNATSSGECVAKLNRQVETFIMP